MWLGLVTSCGGQARAQLHVRGRWMYWTDWEEDPKDSKRGKIERAWMDGSNRNIFITSKTVLWPNGLSLDIPAKILYWVDAFYDRIEMVYLNGTERKASEGPGTLITRSTGAAELCSPLPSPRPCPHPCP